MQVEILNLLMVLWIFCLFSHFRGLPDGFLRGRYAKIPESGPQPARVPRIVSIIDRPSETSLKGFSHRKTGQIAALKKRTPQRPCRPVITCTFTDRWVASNALYRFQLPAADGSREACEPRADPASRITKCGLKKDLSRTPQGTFILSYCGPERKSLFFVLLEEIFHKQVVHRLQLLVGIQSGEEVLAVLVDDF